MNQNRKSEIYLNMFSVFLKVPPRNFNFVLAVVAREVKSGTAYCPEDLA